MLTPAEIVPAETTSAETASRLCGHCHERRTDFPPASEFGHYFGADGPFCMSCQAVLVEQDRVPRIARDPHLLERWIHTTEARLKALEAPGR
jgi:hypothetical protein